VLLERYLLYHTPNKMNRAKWTLVALAVIVVTAILVWRNPHAGRPAAPASTPSSPTPAPVSADKTSPKSLPGAASGLDEKLHSAQVALQSAQDAASKRQQLAALLQALSSTPTNEASRAIREFLDSKADASTGQGFKIGGHGVLNEAPTLRAALLDHLGQIDPAAAAVYAREILSRPDSADEWAVALRNLAWGDKSPEGRALLQQKVGELLRNESWQHNPSTGYLEAFDVAVYLGGVNLVPALSELVRKQDNPAVAHAAFLTFDRMVINEPGQLLAALQADPATMQGREATRADYFARADVRDPQQRQVLESYLLDPRIGAAELAKFAGIFPNANFMISQNLLTPTPTPDHSTLVNRDAESLRIIQDWIADPRFANLRPQLDTAKSRLEEFVKQAVGR